MWKQVLPLPSACFRGCGVQNSLSGCAEAENRRNRLVFIGLKEALVVLLPLASAVNRLKYRGIDRSAEAAEVKRDDSVRVRVRKGSAAWTFRRAMRMAPPPMWR